MLLNRSRFLQLEMKNAVFVRTLQLQHDLGVRLRLSRSLAMAGRVM